MYMYTYMYICKLLCIYGLLCNWPSSTKPLVHVHVPELSDFYHLYQLLARCSLIVSHTSSFVSLQNSTRVLANITIINICITEVLGIINVGFVNFEIWWSHVYTYMYVDIEQC